MRSIILIIMAAVFIVSCSPKIVRHEITGYAQGTTYKIIYYSGVESVKKDGIDSLFNAFNLSCSLYDENSLLSRINRGETDSVDIHIIKCEAIAREIYEISEGAYDITSHPLSRAYGFLKEKRDKNLNLDSILQYVGHDKIAIKDGKLIRKNKGVTLNLNSVAQGYSVDLVAEYMKKRGVNNFLIELGGEIYCSGTKENGELWRVGIDKPTDGNIKPGEDLALVITLTNKGINTSGNYRNFYEDGGKRYNHIIDSRTGLSSVNDMVSATVVAESAALSDVLATMLMLLGSEKSKEFLSSRKDIEGYIIYMNNDKIETFSTLKL